MVSLIKFSLGSRISNKRQAYIIIIKNSCLQHSLSINNLMLFSFYILELLIEKSRISVAPAICRSSMIFEAAFLRTNDCTATARKKIKE